VRSSRGNFGIGVGMGFRVGITRVEVIPTGPEMMRAESPSKPLRPREVSSFPLIPSNAIAASTVAHRHRRRNCATIRNDVAIVIVNAANVHHTRFHRNSP
jgi:hypothetical protein